jgi:hypothetical protein
MMVLLSSVLMERAFARVWARPAMKALAVASKHTRRTMNIIAFRREVRQERNQTCRCIARLHHWPSLGRNECSFVGAYATLFYLSTTPL